MHAHILGVKGMEKRSRPGSRKTQGLDEGSLF